MWGAIDTILAQGGLDLKRLKPSRFQSSSAWWNLQSGDRIHSRHVGADAVQMGTAYSATREIVETGAVTALYQRMILESPPAGTVVQARTPDCGCDP